MEHAKNMKKFDNSDCISIREKVILSTVTTRVLKQILAFIDWLFDIYSLALNISTSF